MAWKEVTIDSDSDVWDKQKPLEGNFIGVEENVGPNSSNMYSIKTQEGEVKVWGSKVLDDKLMGVPKGTLVKIEYEGKVKSKKGTEYHSYKVFIDLDSEPQESPEELVSEEDLAADLNDIFPPEE